MSDKIWLGIDPGLAIVGWAILQENASETPLIIDYGTIETSKKLSTCKRLTEIERDLQYLVQEFDPNGIAIEMPFFNRTIKAAGGVLQALGVINLVCYREAKIEPIFLHQASWKCHLGHGRATKQEVAQMVGNLFNLENLPIDDSVDAIAIAYAGLCGLTNNI
ncbi:crossover junction endodeoxyribonuclease RuvC [Aphanothece sacrum]|uniref:Crossover junction endodeoxyribonuclease RuvC n=1 Tax=Aphanothece sacrum FPU1 TaxID=1920663 RepID=A0A401IFG9_APHSA|nr:crossover junction endodeoxyribonuclease RuvC [Aphanothece sacrum]GBF80025.1 crossover junction endodeoxyribonuclease RuvC [Aphanothece sacrum FPU1]GBF84567.1 crossover junction endodeoxyribonuclease RuvC [Aphanothece sacrum FPU3]